MIGAFLKKFALISLVILLVLLILSACGNGNDETDETLSVTPETSRPTTEASPETVTITIGNHTDLTGVASNAMSILTMALKDMCRYYNEENLIPGVNLEVVDYDGQYDPSNDIPGYQWLKERGADLIFTPVASTAVTLKPRLENDKMVLFTPAAAEEAFDPPGYVFSLGNALAEHLSYTLLKWVAENDPDFPRGRPAKIGGAFWNEAEGAALLTGAEEYAKAHPEQYEWKGGFLTGFGFNWSTEVEALKDCDYVLPPVPMHQFIEQYRKAGHTHAKFIGSDPHAAFLGMIERAGLWDEVDGMLFIRSFRWWNEEGEIMDLTRRLLYEKHPGKADEIRQSGVGYITTQPVYIMLEAVKATVERVGAENFSSEELFETLQSFSIEVDGCSHSYTETKRVDNDALAIFELKAEEKDLFRADPGWLPVVKQP